MRAADCSTGSWRWPSEDQPGDRGLAHRSILLSGLSLSPQGYISLIPLHLKVEITQDSPYQLNPSVNWSYDVLKCVKCSNSPCGLHHPIRRKPCVLFKSLRTYWTVQKSNPMIIFCWISAPLTDDVCPWFPCMQRVMNEWITGWNTEANLVSGQRLQRGCEMGLKIIKHKAKMLQEQRLRNEWTRFSFSRFTQTHWKRNCLWQG